MRGFEDRYDLQTGAVSITEHPIDSVADRVRALTALLGEPKHLRNGTLLFVERGFKDVPRVLIHISTEL